MNLRLDLAYNGKPFHGFARQADVRTIQGDIEQALGRLNAGPVKTTGAGRTDTGVHALGQVVSAPDVRDDLDLGRLMDALNGMLGPHISIISARAAAPDFDARFSARSRTYVYAILRRSTPDPFLSGTALWHRDELEIETMNEAAGHLVGAHDFSSFGRVEEGGSAERNLFELRVARSGDLVKIRARANAFIHQMVRSLVGTMIYVGEGRRDPGDIPAILAARDRSAAGPVAPAHGLCLVAVEYDEGWSVPPHPGS